MSNALLTIALAAVASLFGTALLSTAAQAQTPRQGDIVFLVDESASVRGIQTGLANNVVNIANQLTTENIDWRIGVGGFGRAFGGNPRVATGFTSSIADVQAATQSLVATGGTEYGLQAIINATTGVVTNYGVLRPGAGYCVVLLTDEDSDYVSGSNAIEQRQDALAGLQGVGAGFIAAVATQGNTDADYRALVAPGSGVNGQIFDITNFVANPDTVGREIIDTCIDEIFNAPSELSINDVTVNEDAGTATLTISVRPTSTEAIEITVSTQDGSAIEGDDYSNVIQTLTFAPGEVEKTIQIPIIDDQTSEPTETLTVVLSNPSGASIADGEGIVTILDDDDGGKGGDKGGSSSGGKGGSSSSGGSSSGGSSSGGKGGSSGSSSSSSGGSGPKSAAAALSVRVKQVRCRDTSRAKRCMAVTVTNTGQESLKNLRVATRRGKARRWSDRSRLCELPRTLAAGARHVCMLPSTTPRNRAVRTQVLIRAVSSDTRRRLLRRTR